MSQVPSVGLGDKTADDPDVGQQAAQQHLQLLRELQGALHMIALRAASVGGLRLPEKPSAGPGETAAEGASAGQLAAQQRLEAICRHRGSCKAAAAAEESPQAWVRKMHDCRCRCMGAKGGNAGRLGASTDEATHQPCLNTMLLEDTLQFLSSFVLCMS